MTTKTKGISRRMGALVGVSAAAVVAAAAFAGAEGAIRLPGVDAIQSASAEMVPAAFQPPGGAPISFADIFERVSPAVVSIRVDVEREVPASLEIPGFPGFQFQVPPGEGEPQTRRGTAEGSGFFISSDGYIVTNNHVVADADKIRVILKDERELEATVVGLDPETDLAVLKVSGSNYPFVNFENAARPRVGDWVIAIGNPFGLGGSASVGIISGEGRRPDSQDPSRPFVDFIQIDAAINSGNSGGPTFDVNGRVIGVNSQILSPNPRGGSVGIGFAIPASVADNVTKQLIAEGSVTRGYLGASVYPFDRDIALSIGMELGEERPSGAFIADVTAGGPAERAGLEPGDIVTAINGESVRDNTALTRMVAGTRAGENMRLSILRSGRAMTINVRAGRRPSLAELRGEVSEEPSAAAGRGGRGRGGAGRAAAPPEEAVKLPSVLGMSLSPLDDAARRRFRVAEGVSGVVVMELENSSEVARAGLRPGDVITRAGNAAVTRPEQVIEAVEAQRNAGRETVLLLVRRGQVVQPLIVQVGAAANKQG